MDDNYAGIHGISITHIPLNKNRRGKCHYQTECWKKIKGRKEYICDKCNGIIQKGEIHIGQIGMIRTGYHSSYDIMISRRHEKCGVPEGHKLEELR